jgi:stearoyl-CoA desaturase (Delta-9 desaturase)
MVATTTPPPARLPWRVITRLGQTLRGVFDNDYYPEGKAAVMAGPKTWDWAHLAPFLVLHLACLSVLWVGFSWTALGVAVALYWVRMFAITAFYHRYFSHRTFQTSRLMQAVFAVWGLLSAQKGPLWWAAHHRQHHRLSDTPHDLHSAKQRGFWWSHLGWIACRANMPTDYTQVPDLARYPELVFLNRFDWLVPALLGLSLWLAGDWLAAHHPGLHTNGPQLFVWGFLVSTVVLFHGTCTINSLSHLWGSRRFETTDTSRNNGFLALLTLGEGWHNNHHAHPGCTRQGFAWWEVDVTYYGLRLMALVGLVRQLHPVPVSARDVVAGRSPQAGQGGAY